MNKNNLHLHSLAKFYKSLSKFLFVWISFTLSIVYGLENAIEDHKTAQKIYLEANKQDKKKTDLYLENTVTKKKTFLATMENVVRGELHSLQLVNQKLYLKKRTGDLNNNWTDELWRYGKNKMGEKLFSVKGFSFSVNHDESLIVLDASNDIFLLQNDGSIIKKFDMIEILKREDEMDVAQFHCWGKNSVWFQITNSGADLMEFLKIDLSTFTTQLFDLKKLEGGEEYVLNPQLGLLAFSTFPSFFDGEDLQTFKASNKKVSLKIYDFKTNSISQIIDVSNAKEFEPIWRDSISLEYNDPKSHRRIIKKFNTSPEQ